jgi:glycerol-3-phosphate dehydrogenase
VSLRQNNLASLSERTFDVLVLGGGINGAVSSSSLTARGASVALIDRGDFAGQTSQESSNLVWGGIKYLETFEFALVRKLCVSRNHLIDSYPSTIRKVRFYAAIETGFRKSRFLIYLGTLLYWAIGNFFTKKPRLLSVANIAKDEPVINTGNVVGGVEYSDAYLVDNDARFVFKFIRAAMDHGAVVANYVRFDRSERDSDGLWTAHCHDVITGQPIAIRARVLINATGPYVDAINGITAQETRHHHVFSKGVHLIVDRITDAPRVLTFFADDGRLFFVIPMGPKSCIGTTDTRVLDVPPHVTDEDRQFILDNVNKRLKLPRPLTTADIIAERCGARPLVVSRSSNRNADWSALSRKHVIESNREQRYLSVLGGKLTDCINIGNEVAQIVRDLGVRLPYFDHVWYGEPSLEIKNTFFHQARLMRLDNLTAPESSELISSRLWRRYGAAALGLLEAIQNDPAMADVLITGTEYTRCEIHLAARREMITKLEDFLRRRSKIALIARIETIRDAPGLMEACSILFGDQAQARFNEYFVRHRDSGHVA